MKKFLFLSSLVLFSIQSVFPAEDNRLQNFGGKASSLVQLEKIPGIRVPKWTCIDTAAFQEFIEQTGIIQKIEELDATEDETSLFAKAQEIRISILESPFSPEFHRSVKQKINSMLQNCEAIAVRSSCVFEDLPGSSFAGLYDTYLNQKDEESIEYSIKQCWASVFNDRAIVERNRLGIDHKKALIAVIMQEMVIPKVAGTAFSSEISTGYDGIEIVANYGLGESVVDGSTTVDKWLVHPKTHRIIKSTLGDKKLKVIFTSTGSGVLIDETSEEEKKQYCMDQNTVLKVAKQLQKIAANYKSEHIDTEFAINKDNQIYFLQARPLVNIQNDEIMSIDREKCGSAHILAKGLYGVPGTLSGKLKVIPSLEDLEKGRITIEADDIVVTYVSTNNWTQYMTKFKGMITQEGGPTSHPILLCRERKVPCVIGIDPDVFDHLLNLNNTEATIDGTNQIVYEGKLPLKKSTLKELSSRFDLVKKEVLSSYEEQIKEFQRYNFLITEILNGKKVFWQKKPTFRPDSVLREINLMGFNKRAALLGIDHYPSKAKVIDGYVVEQFMTDKEKLSYLSHMDLEKSKAFFKDHETTLKRYEEVTQNFSLSVDNWKEYIDTVTSLRAYIWFGYSFRQHINSNIAQESHRLQIPRYYIEAYAEQLQASKIEEDTRLFNDIREFAKRIQPHSHLSFEKFAKTQPEQYLQLEHLGKQYRFQLNNSFKEELDLEKLYNRIVKESQNAIHSPMHEAKPVEHDYFPQDDELRQWIALSINSRIIQSDTHHKLIRGQWKVREQLMKLGKGKAIFDCSLNEIEKDHLST